jgi:hypothetical protein
VATDDAFTIQGHDYRRQSVPVGAPLRGFRVSPHRSTERWTLMPLGAKTPREYSNIAKYVKTSWRLKDKTAD